jgi:hypothetical protein
MVKCNARAAFSAEVELLSLLAVAGGLGGWEGKAL